MCICAVVAQLAVASALYRLMPPDLQLSYMTTKYCGDFAYVETRDRKLTIYQTMAEYGQLVREDKSFANPKLGE